MTTAGFLRLVALIFFVIAAFISFFVTTPDAFDVLGCISGGLAAWVASTLVK